MADERTVDPLNQYRQKRYQATHGDALAFRRRHARGRLTARERLLKLLDPGSFEELDLLVRHRSRGFGLEESRPYGDGVITGHGHIDGRPVVVFSHDASVFGGSLGEVFAEKVCKVMDLAMRDGIPIVGINDSGGARIQEGVVSLAGYAEIFWRNVEASGVVPQLSLILGPCTGGAVYSPAITDFTFMVENLGYMFITGPEVVRATTGERVDFEQLGGASIHATRSGVAHFTSPDEESCLRLTREVFGFLPLNRDQQPPRITPADSPTRPCPDLAHILPETSREAYDMREVIAQVVDEGRYLEVQPLWAMNIVCAFARLDGHVVGVVGNQPRILAGALDIDASVKGARFVRFCDAFNIPLLVFEDVPGFLPGTAQEYGGIIRHGAKLLYAFAEATVPKLTVIVRKAYGGAYCVMCSKHIRADFNFAWPTAEMAVMGAEGAVDVIFRRRLAEAEDRAALRERLLRQVEEEFSGPFVAAERGYVDQVIEPTQTRAVLVTALNMALRKERRRKPRWHGNIPL